MSEGPRPLLLRPEDIAPRPAAAPVRGKEDLRKAATAFEGMVVSQMLKAMRKTVPRSGLLGDSGQARATLEYLLDQAVVDAAMAGGRTRGLARRVEEAWKAKQAGAESLNPKTVQGSGKDGR